MQMNYYPKILPFYMTYPMPLIWEEEDTVMRDLEYLQELYPRQAKKYRKRIEELLERFDSEGSVLYDEYPDRMTLYKMAQDIYAVLEQEEKREQAEAAAVAAAPAPAPVLCRHSAPAHTTPSAAPSLHVRCPPMPAGSAPAQSSCLPPPATLPLSFPVPFSFAACQRRLLWSFYRPAGSSQMALYR